MSRLLGRRLGRSVTRGTPDPPAIRHTTGTCVSTISTHLITVDFEGYQGLRAWVPQHSIGVVPGDTVDLLIANDRIRVTGHYPAGA